MCYSRPMNENSEILSAVEVAQVLGVTKARVHQMAVPGPAGEDPILPPDIEKMAPSGKVTFRGWRRDRVRHHLELREAVPPTRRGPVRWDPDFAEAELAAHSR